MGSQEISFHIFFRVGKEKVRLDEKIPYIVSELSLEFSPTFERKPIKIDKNRDFNDFGGFSAKIRVKYYTSSILRPYLGSSQQDDLLHRNMKANLKMYFLASHNI